MSTMQRPQSSRTKRQPEVQDSLVVTGHDGPYVALHLLAIAVDELQDQDCDRADNIGRCALVQTREEVEKSATCDGDETRYPRM
jgi:hypothetical protein